MATVFTHALVGGSLALLTPRDVSRPGFMIAAAALAMAPDADVVGFALGISYAHPLGHRGLTHSLLFSLSMGLLAAFLFVKQTGWWTKTWWQISVLLSIAATSHGFLDAFTDAGLGIGFFIPFDNSRYFFPWRPIATSPIGVSQFFSTNFLRILQIEFLYIWLPTLFVWFSVWMAKINRSGK